MANLSQRQETRNSGHAAGDGKYVSVHIQNQLRERARGKRNYIRDTVTADTQKCVRTCGNNSKSSRTRTAHANPTCLISHRHYVFDSVSILQVSNYFGSLNRFQSTPV
jgi:hypothetical protein